MSDKWTHLSFLQGPSLAQIQRARAPYRHRFWAGMLCLLACGIVCLGTGSPVHAQAGLREALDRLDTDGDGRIDPDEVTPLARPYLERIARAGSRRSDLRFDRPMSIERIQEVARRYYAVRNGVDDRGVRPEREDTVRSFGPDPDQPLVPEFGLAEIKYPYTEDDLEEADRTMRRYDRNDDRFIDAREASRQRWTHRNPFEDDMNKDGRLSRLELAQRYARRRLLDDLSDELRRKAWRTGGEIRDADRRDRRRDDSRWWRRGGSSTWLTASMMGRFDSNRNGRLELTEAERLGLPVGQIDADGNGEISREELHALVAEMQDEAGDMTEGLPGWFFELDSNRDGQVAMHEFTADWTDEKQDEFAALDANGDGLLTAPEVQRSTAAVGGRYRNEEAQVLPPRRTIISEIEVEDDYLIRDLDVQLSITHTHVSHLDAYLTGPDGQRIELFTQIGGSGDHFERTQFDDQSGSRITKARPPFRGSYRPEAIDKKQPGLSRFNGKSVRGVWQLVVRGTRSERFGMLHGWGLVVAPEEEVPAVNPSEPEGNGAGD